MSGQWFSRILVSCAGVFASVGFVGAAYLGHPIFAVALLPVVFGAVAAAARRTWGVMLLASGLATITTIALWSAPVPEPPTAVAVEPAVEVTPPAAVPTQGPEQLRERGRMVAKDDLNHGLRRYLTTAPGWRLGTHRRLLRQELGFHLDGAWVGEYTESYVAGYDEVIDTWIEREHDRYVLADVWKRARAFDLRRARQTSCSITEFPQWPVSDLQLTRQMKAEAAEVGHEIRGLRFVEVGSEVAVDRAAASREGLL